MENKKERERDRKKERERERKMVRVKLGEREGYSDLEREKAEMRGTFRRSK